MRHPAQLLGALLLATGLHAAEPAGSDAMPAVDTSAEAPPPARTPVREPDVPQSPAASSEPAGAAPATAAPATGGEPDSNTTDIAPARTQSRGAAGADRIELGATQITGNAELPRVMYVVPWKRAELGDLAGKPARSLLDEVLAPVDRDVFRRQNRYYDALRPDAAAAAP